MKLLVFGAKGQLGSELLRVGRQRGIALTGVDLPECDITDCSQLEQAIERARPGIIINAAAYTQVDRAESEAEPAAAVNRDAVGCLARLCRLARISLIHISTDYVFNGRQSRPYLETDQIDPQGVYGRSKAEGEAVALENLRELIIIRTSWLYGATGPNFVKTILRLAGEREELRVVADQWGTPTAAVDLAEAALDISDRIQRASLPAWGIYHYSGRGITTWFGFAQAVVAAAQRHKALKVKAIHPITTADYPTPAQRPAYSALDCGAIEREFGVVPKPWQERLECLMPNILNQGLT